MAERRAACCLRLAAAAAAAARRRAAISRSSPRDEAIKRSVDDLTEKWINYNDNGWTVDGTPARWPTDGLTA